MMVLFPTPSLMSTKCLKKLINCTKTIGNCSKEGYRFLLVIEKCACGVRGYVSVTCGKLFHLIDWIVYIRLMDIIRDRWISWMGAAAIDVSAAPTKWKRAHSIRNGFVDLTFA